MKLFSIKKENIKIFLLVIVIIVNMFGVMLPRFFNDQTEKTGEFFKYPIHVDEWQHYTISSSLKESFLQPTVFYYKDSEKFLDGSPFFHWMIYLFQIFGGGLNIFFVLPLIQISFLSIVLFLLLSKIFNIPIAFFSSIIVGFLKTNMRFLGTAFFVPFVMSFTFFIWAIYILCKNEKINFSFIIISIISILTYPPFILPLIIFALTYCLFYKKKNKNIILFLGLMLFVVAILFLIFLKGNFSLFLNKIIYKNYWTGNRGFDLMGFLTIPIILLGLYGFIKNLKKTKILPLNAVLLFFILSLLIAFFTGYSIGFHYVRIITIGSMIFACYTGVGLWDLFKFLKRKINKLIAILILIILLLVILYPTFNFYKGGYKSHLNPSFYGKWYTKDSIEALDYLRSLKNKNIKLLHPVGMGSVITPMTNFKVTALSVFTTGGKENKYYEIKNLNDCSLIKNIIEEEKYNLLWLKEEKNCSFLKEQFKNDSHFIYKYIIN